MPNVKMRTKRSITETKIVEDTLSEAFKKALEALEGGDPDELTVEVTRPGRLPVGLEAAKIAIDHAVRLGYANMMDELKDIANFNFTKAMIAAHYGVPESDVTSDFLAEKRALAEQRFREELKRYEIERQITLRKDTPAERRRVMRKVQKMIALARE